MKNVLWLLTVLAVAAVYLQPGHWLMIGALLIMIVVHELGHWAVARWYGINTPVFSIGFGSAPRVVLFKLWDTEFQITPWLFGGYVQIDLAGDQFLSRPARQRFAVMVAGVVMNVVLALVVVTGAFLAIGQPVAKYDGAYVKDLVGGPTAARAAGLQPGDKFRSVDGIPITTPQDLQRTLAAHKDGSSANLVIERAGKERKVIVHPDGAGHIGIMLGSNVTVEHHRMGPVAAVKNGAAVTYDMSTRLIYGVAAMLHIVPMPPGVPAGADEMHGIVAIVQIGNQALQNGAFSFLMMVALISINFAVMNILPIPMLDGGHIAYLAWEKITGRPVPMQVQGLLNMVFLMLLLGLMVYGLVNDIVHPVSLLK